MIFKILEAASKAKPSTKNFLSFFFKSRHRKHFSRVGTNVIWIGPISNTYLAVYEPLVTERFTSNHGNSDNFFFYNEAYLI